MRQLIARNTQGVLNESQWERHGKEADLRRTKKAHHYSQMRSIKRIGYCFFIAILALSSVILADEFHDSEVPAEIQFIHADTHYMTGEREEEWERKLAETPGITNKEYDLLWRFMEVKYDTQVGQVLNALGMRSDLSASQLNRIVDRMKCISTGSLNDLPPEELEFLCGGIRLL